MSERAENFPRYRSAELIENRPGLTVTAAPGLSASLGEYMIEDVYPDVADLSRGVAALNRLTGHVLHIHHADFTVESRQIGASDSSCYISRQIQDYIKEGSCAFGFEEVQQEKANRAFEVSGLQEVPFATYIVDTLRVAELAQGDEDYARTLMKSKYDLAISRFKIDTKDHLTKHSTDRAGNAVVVTAIASGLGVSGAVVADQLEYKGLVIPLFTVAGVALAGAAAAVTWLERIKYTSRKKIVEIETAFRNDIRA